MSRYHIVCLTIFWTTGNLFGQERVVRMVVQFDDVCLVTAHDRCDYHCFVQKSTASASTIPLYWTATPVDASNSISLGQCSFDPCILGVDLRISFRQPG